MKIMKTITIDADLYYKIKEQNINFSQLVNGFLKLHFDIKPEDSKKNEEMLKNELLMKEADLLTTKQALEITTAKRIKEDGVPFMPEGWKN